MVERARTPSKSFNPTSSLISVSQMGSTSLTVLPLYFNPMVKPHSTLCKNKKGGDIQGEVVVYVSVKLIHKRYFQLEGVDLSYFSTISPKNTYTYVT